MGYRLRQMTRENNFCQEMPVAMLDQVISPAVIAATLADEGVQAHRVRKLDLVVTVLVIIGMNLYPHLALGGVLRKLSRGLRFIWHDPDYVVAGDSALCYRRYQVGARVLAQLFRRICRPMATPATRGAFLFGLRLMALDGTAEDVADTPANEAAFGRHRTYRAPSAFPQIQCVYLAECGTRAIVDAGFWPGQTSERVGGRRLMRSVTAGMLLLWDRGFHEYDMVTAVQQRGAQLLGRVPACLKPLPVTTLPDGSRLVYLQPANWRRRRSGERCLVRLIEYRLTDPALADTTEVHRLITTLLDPVAYPLSDLVCAFHERWEIELAIDEIDTHQRLTARTLRSLKPVGVIQELYGLLLAHYVIRYLMHQAALDADLDPDRLSFVQALEVIKEAIPEFQMVAIAQQRRLFRRLLRDIAAKPLPPRRLRINPRVVKRKMSNYKKKRPEHVDWPQPAGPFREAIEVI